MGIKSNKKQLLVQNTKNSFFIHVSESITIEEIKQEIERKEGIHSEEQVLLLDGKQLKVLEYALLKNLSIIRVNLRLKGGKGGFGSLLRGQASTRRKITNFDASRDLKGRRIRNVNNHKKLIEFLKKKKTDDNIIENEVNMFKIMEKNNRQIKYNQKLNQNYKNKLNKCDQEMGNSVWEGFNKKKNLKKNVETEEECKIEKKIHISFEDTLKKIMNDEIKGIENLTEKIDKKIKPVKVSFNFFFLHIFNILGTE